VPVIADSIPALVAVANRPHKEERGNDHNETGAEKPDRDNPSGKALFLHGRNTVSGELANILEVAEIGS